MVDSDPRITTVIAVYNMADTLQRAIDSAVNQDYHHKELIVVEGASTDNTVEVLRANDQVIDYWESVPAGKRGIYYAWNVALDHVSGDWINFLGADDYYTNPDVLSRVAPRLKACPPNMRLVYGMVALVTKDDEVSHLVGQPWRSSKHLLRTAISPIPHPGTFHAGSLFDSHGKFDESFRIAGDYEFLLRELKQADALFMYDIVVKNMTAGGLSTASETDLQTRLEVARARKLNGFFPYPAQWCWRFAKAAGMRALGRTVGPKGAGFVQNCYQVLTFKRPLWQRKKRNG